jgi:heme exporter protein CcmD
MTNGGYVFAGYGLTFATLVAYVAWMLRRGRSLSKQVPPEDRRWM